MTWGFVTCGPNEALVISGCCYTKPHLVPGGRAFIWPAIQRIQRISLNTMTLQVDSPTVYTSQGVPISVTGIAQVKIQGQNEEMLLAACEQFLGKKESEIQHIALVTLEGHQRAIMGSMTVEEIYKDRKKFSKQVFEVASSDLVNMGITVVSYTLKDIRDEEGYLRSLGMARTAEVKRDARIGEAEARCDAQIKEAIAEEQRMASVFLNDTDIARACRDFELKKAAYDVEVQTKNAEAEMAFELQAAKTKQRIKEEQMQIKVVERTQEIAVQEQEIARRERELEATVRRPAEAEKYRLEKIAEANNKRVLLEAEAEAEAIRLKGQAEAFAIEAKAKAEAEQMAKKAEAWKEYKEAAMIDMLLDVLPKVAAEVAAPLSQTKKITMVSSGDGNVGASKLTDEVFTIVSRVPELVRTMTGVDIAKGYLKSLGLARAAQVKRDARIGEAEARSKAQIKEALAEEQRMASVFYNNTEIARAARDFEMKKAAYDVEVQTKNAEAEMAFELQAAKTKQKIKEEQMQIKVVERTQEIAVQEQEIARRERELEATVRRPAEAEKYRLEKIAEANNKRVLLEAEAEAEAIRLKGQAEAFAIEARAKADAEQMSKKAEAWKEYQDAAMIDMLLDVLPKVAAEVAAPLSQTKKITMVSSGDGNVGASKLTDEVFTIVSRVPELVKTMTGVDVAKSVHAA